MKLGLTYTITGVKQIYFAAWNCEKYIHRPIRLDRNDIFIKFAEFRERSPWMLVYALSMVFAQEIYPQTLFSNLKIGILLSLASLNVSQNYLYTKSGSVSIQDETITICCLLAGACQFYRYTAKLHVLG